MEFHSVNRQTDVQRFYDATYAQFQAPAVARYHRNTSDSLSIYI